MIYVKKATAHKIRPMKSDLKWQTIRIVSYNKNKEADGWKEFI